MKWYQVGDERRKLSSVDVHRPENAGAVLIVCPDCIYELETGEPVPEGVIHECDDYLQARQSDGLDLTFRLPTKEELEELEHPGPQKCELVIRHYLHGTLKEKK